LIFSLFILWLTKKSSRTEKKSTKLKAVKQAFLDCMSSSTMHGLPQMAKPENLLLLLLWIIFFFVAFGGCIYMIFQSVEEF